MKVATLLKQSFSVLSKKKTLNGCLLTSNRLHCDTHTPQQSAYRYMYFILKSKETQTGLQWKKMMLPVQLPNNVQQLILPQHYSFNATAARDIQHLKVTASVPQGPSKGFIHKLQVVQFIPTNNYKRFLVTFLLFQFFNR